MKNKLFVVLFVCLLLVGCGVKEQKEELNNKETPSDKEQKKEYSNLGYFVGYKDDLYYWKLNSNSRTSTELFASYNDIKDSTNELIKLDKNGNESVILKDKGSQDLVISNDKIYTSYFVKNTERIIYSIDLLGNNKKEITEGFLKGVTEYGVVGVTSSYLGNIFIINPETDDYRTLKEKVNWVGIDNDTIYYSDYNSESELIIGTLNNNEDKELLTITTSEFKGEDIPELSVEKIIFNGELVEMYVGYRDGSAVLLQELIKVTMDKDGSNISKEYISDLSYMETFISSEEVYWDIDSWISYTDKNNNQNKIINTKELAKQYNLPETEETTMVLYKGNVVDNDVYFIIDYGTHDSSEDLGWRYAYKRNVTIYFKYDINEKELEKVYEF